MTRPLRLDKLLSRLGYGGRRELKKLGRTGAVRVNGETEKDLSRIVDPDLDEITFFDEAVHYRQYVTLMLNKPDGIVSATTDPRFSTVVDLVSEDYRSFHLFPIGRLDRDTTGLLLLTNDGTLAHRLLSPKRRVPKTYKVETDGLIDEEAVKLLETGILLERENIMTLPAEVTLIPENPASCLLKIFEGKNHQVKRMFQSVGLRVVNLSRIAFGPLALDKELAPGQMRELTEEELDDLYHAAGRQRE
jgi:16S rRNA pseudouridine516 synthase